MRRLLFCLGYSEPTLEMLVKQRVSRTVIVATAAFCTVFLATCGGETPSGPLEPEPPPAGPPQPGRLAFVSQPGNIALGSRFGTVVVVEVRDSTGARDPRATPSIVLTLADESGEATLYGLRAATADAGTAVFPDIRVNRSGFHRLRATSVGLDSVVSNEFEVEYKFRQLITRDLHTCAVTTGDLYLCWGFSQSGQLMVPNRGDVIRPIEITGAVVFDSISLGGFHSCGLRNGGLAACWGQNWDGELGTGQITANKSSPQTVVGGHVFVSLSASPGAHNCGLISNGDVYCWGRQIGRLSGDEAEDDALSPIIVPGGVPFAQIATGNGHSCGITNDGAGYCWGFPEDKGSGTRLGTGLRTESWEPLPIAGGHEFRLLSGGVWHSCAIDSANQAWCWGRNLGRLGDGTEDDRLSPVAVQGGIDFRTIRAGFDHTCGVSFNDIAYCWGSNRNGELGVGPQVPSSLVPLPVAGGLKFATVEVARDFTCGLTTDGEAYCWGWNERGHLGIAALTLEEYFPMKVAEPDLP